MSDDIKKTEETSSKAEPSVELSEQQLENAVGGAPSSQKANLQDFHFTRKLDQSTPNLF